MKTFIVVLCFIVSVQSGKGGKGNKHELPAGCENPPKDIKLTQCCSSLPKFFSKESMKSCSGTCKAGKKPDRICCKTDCALNALGVLTNGNFDAAKAKQSFSATIAANPAWTSDLIGGIVDGCVNGANATLSSLRSQATSKKFSPNCTDATSLNMVIGQCIRREMFFQCPGLSTSADCTALVTYGKGCPIFPYQKGNHGDKDGDDNKKNGKNRS